MSEIYEETILFILKGTMTFSYVDMSDLSARILRTFLTNTFKNICEFV